MYNFPLVEEAVFRNDSLCKQANLKLFNWVGEAVYFIYTERQMNDTIK